MAEIVLMVNTFIANLPAILIALTGLIVVWKKVDAVGAMAQQSVDRTEEGNKTLDKVHDLVKAASEVDPGPLPVVVVHSPEHPIHVVPVKE